MMTVPQTLDDQGTMSVEMSFFQSRKESPSHRFAHLYWYFPWFHELSFPWYGFENPIEPIEPVEIYVYYSGMDRKAMTESCEGKGNLCYEAGKSATCMA